MHLPDVSLYTPDKVVEIDASAIPGQPATVLVRLADEMYRKMSGLEDFNRLMKFTELGGYSVYFAQHEVKSRHYAIGRFTSVLVADVVGERLVGEGEMIYEPTPQPNDDNVSRVTITESWVKKKGYGTKRYLAMNAVSQLIAGGPLQSAEVGEFLSAAATRRWEAFVRAGLARKHNNRYRFI